MGSLVLQGRKGAAFIQNATDNIGSSPKRENHDRDHHQASGDSGLWEWQTERVRLNSPVNVQGREQTEKCEQCCDLKFRSINRWNPIATGNGEQSTTDS